MIHESRQIEQEYEKRKEDLNSIFAQIDKHLKEMKTNIHAANMSDDEDIRDSAEVLHTILSTVYTENTTVVSCGTTFINTSAKIIRFILQLTKTIQDMKLAEMEKKEISGVSNICTEWEKRKHEDIKRKERVIPEDIANV
jgi:hypothetical protein